MTIIYSPNFWIKPEHNHCRAIFRDKSRLLSRNFRQSLETFARPGLHGHWRFSGDFRRWRPVSNAFLPRTPLARQPGRTPVALHVDNRGLGTGATPVTLVWGKFRRCGSGAHAAPATEPPEAHFPAPKGTGPVGNWLPQGGGRHSGSRFTGAGVSGKAGALAVPAHAGKGRARRMQRTGQIELARVSWPAASTSRTAPTTGGGWPMSRGYDDRSQ